MKKFLLSLIVITTLISLTPAALTRAQDKSSAAQTYEYGMIKWDGPDKIQIITPGHTEILHAFKSGLQLPDGIHDEELCVTWAINRVAKNGWEPVTLHATRVLLRRPTNP